MLGCGYLGPEFDPRKWDYSKGPTPYCNKPTLTGKNYCAEHYGIMYQKGSAIAGKRAAKAVEKEIEAIKRAEEDMSYE